MKPINIVYAPSTGPASIIYQNDQGTIWTSREKQSGMHNIGMGWYSIPNPQPEDSIMVMEPFCVLDKDYEVEFVKQYKYIFTWAIRAFSDPSLINKIIEINHPSCHNLPLPENLAKNWLPWNERADEIVFIANNKTSRHDSELYSFRLQLADFLHQKSKYKVSWYGEIPISKPYYRGPATSKYDILSKVKFSVCTENSWHHRYTYNYFTEKMPEVWLAGAMPIYMGCYNIDHFGFPAHSYIDLRIYCQKRGNYFEIDAESLLSRIEAFDAPRYENLKMDIILNAQSPNGWYNLISYSRVYDKIIRSFVE